MERYTGLLYPKILVLTPKKGRLFDMIRQEILKELLPFTAEELEFLDGRKTINRD